MAKTPGIQVKSTLSDKIHCMKHNYKSCKWVYPEEDVKEAVARLKEILSPIFEMLGSMSLNDIMIHTFQNRKKAIQVQDNWNGEFIKEIFGEELVEAKE